MQLHHESHPKGAWKVIAKGGSNFCKIGYWIFRQDAERALSHDRCIKWTFAGPFPNTGEYDDELCRR